MYISTYICIYYFSFFWGFPDGAVVNKPTCQCRRWRRCRFDPWLRKIPWNRKWQPTLVLLPGKYHGQRNLVGYSPWGRRELDMTEHAGTTFLSIHPLSVSFLTPLFSWPFLLASWLLKLLPSFNVSLNTITCQVIFFHFCNSPQITFLPPPLIDIMRF